MKKNIHLLILLTFSFIFWGCDYGYKSTVSSAILSFAAWGVCYLVISILYDDYIDVEPFSYLIFGFAVIGFFAFGLWECKSCVSTGGNESGFWEILTKSFIGAIVGCFIGLVVAIPMLSYRKNKRVKELAEQEAKEKEEEERIKKEIAEKIALGYHLEMVEKRCPACKGSTFCPKCGRTGRCLECGGSGSRFDYDRYKKCYACGGTGLCKVCGGKAVCPVCKGIGVVNIPEWVKKKDK